MRKKLISLLLSMAMLASLALPAAAEEAAGPLDGYADVDAGAWYAEAVLFAVENGYMTGTGEGTFAPDATVTRATVFHTLWNMNGQPTPQAAVVLTGEEGEETWTVDAASSAFADVVGTWYDLSANWAAELGLTTGDGTGAYAGDRAVTRAELATILVRYAESSNCALTAGDLSAYVDAADVAGWAAESMKYAVGSGLMSGKDGGRLDPNGTAVRAELAQLLRNLAALDKAYIETAVSIEVEESDGIPAHSIPAVVTMPGDAQDVPAVVMLHGTGSNKDEAGEGYILAARQMAENGVASIRIDFMGNGDSTADYADYNYTSASIDAKAAADYLAGLDGVNGGQIAVLGWSQGGTNALVAAAGYPETFSAVITWAGAMDLAGAGLFPEGFDAAYEIAQEDGAYEMTFDWREPLQVGERWFEEVLATDMDEVAASIEAPILAINGLSDTTVPPANAERIAAAGQDARTYLIEDCDHTFNVFTGSTDAICEAVDAGLGFLMETYQGSVAGVVTGISKYGNVTTSIPEAVMAGAGYELGDILKVTAGDQTVTAPFGDAYSNVDNGQVVVLPDSDTGTIAAAINMGNFAGTYGLELDSPIAFSMEEKGGYLAEYELRSIDALRTNDRADYASDEVFANFRAVVMGDIPEGRLYRSSSPVNPELGRNTYADALAEAAGVQTVLNLADSEEAMTAYEGYADTYYAALNVIPLDMGVDFAAEDFNTKLCSGLIALAEGEGPYLIHCNEGKDRAGFVTALLEALCGASAEEIIGDYMLSYENYYHIERGSEQWDKIAQSNIVKSLCTIAGVETEAELAEADLAAAAGVYLTQTVGLTAEQTQAVYTALTASADA